MDADEMAARVRALVDAAPPLSPSQQAVIRAMLAPAQELPERKVQSKDRRRTYREVVRASAA